MCIDKSIKLVVSCYKDNGIYFCKILSILQVKKFHVSKNTEIMIQSQIFLHVLVLLCSLKVVSNFIVKLRDLKNSNYIFPTSQGSFPFVLKFQ